MRHLILILCTSVFYGCSTHTAIAAPAQSIEISFLTATAAGQVPTTIRYPGDKTIVKVTGLERHTRYLLRNTFVSPGYPTYESTLETFSDLNGVIESDQARPVGGSYADTDADGIFWSMIQTDVRVGLAPGYTLTLEKDGSPLTTAVLPVAYTKPGVRTIDLSGTGLVGKLYLPARTDGPFPVVITYSGSEGGVITGLVNASALANQGFAALGLAYFNAPGLPEDLKEIPLEYFEKAIRFLKSRPDIGEIAVMGASRGGELSLLLGSTFPDVKAVVAQVPSPLRWGGGEPDANGNYPAAWTFHGLAQPYAQPVGDLVETILPDGRKAYRNRPAFEKGLANQTQDKAAMMEIEKIQGPILLLGGEDDQVWPSCRLSEIAIRRLKAKGHPLRDRMVCYPRAGHQAVAVPFLPTTQTAIEHPVMHVLLDMGGTPEGNANAQRKSWETSVQFLRRNLKNSL